MMLAIQLLWTGLHAIIARYTIVHGQTVWVGQLKR